MLSRRRRAIRGSNATAAARLWSTKVTDKSLTANQDGPLTDVMGALQKIVFETQRLTRRGVEVDLMMKDLVFHQQNAAAIAAHPNPFTRFGRKCFSQNDEDGLTLEIVKRLGLVTGVFAEFGVGDGLENNTLILAALGWKGFWVGGSDLAFNHSQARRFKYIKDWITLANITEHCRAGLDALGEQQLDVASLDLDGNDIYFVRALLESGVQPKLFIVEYNAKFPPPVKFQITYDPKHKWMGDDYFGASLASYAELFAEFGYGLVCCNAATGCNAFFVKAESMALFPETPADIGDIYAGPLFQTYTAFGHRVSAKTIERIMNG